MNVDLLMPVSHREWPLALVQSPLLALRGLWEPMGQATVFTLCPLTDLKSRGGLS